MQTTKLLLLTTLLTAVTAQQGRPQCSEDPCFVEAGLPSSCCVLDVPAVAALGASPNITMDVAWNALAAYVDTVCASECRLGFTGPYRQCLLEAPVDQQLVNDYAPEGLCNLKCLVDEGFTPGKDCKQYLNLNATCKDEAREVGGLIGEMLANVFDTCDNASSAPAPFVKAASGPATPARSPLAAPTTATPANGAVSSKDIATSLLGAVFIITMLL